MSNRDTEREPSPAEFDPADFDLLPNPFEIDGPDMRESQLQHDLDRRDFFSTASEKVMSLLGLKLRYYIAAGALVAGASFAIQELKDDPTPPVRQNDTPPAVELDTPLQQTEIDMCTSQMQSDLESGISITQAWREHTICMQNNASQDFLKSFD